MRQKELENLKKLFEDENIPSPSPSYNMIELEIHHPNKLLLFISNLKQSEKKPDAIIEHTSSNVKSSIIKSINKDYKVFYNNYLNIVSQNKKIATVAARELKRSLSRTSKTNPTLKSKKINKELNNTVRKISKENKISTKKEEKEEEIRRKKEEEEQEALRQKRKFNYLMSQTEAFSSFFLNKKRKIEDNEDIECDDKARIAIKEQVKHINEYEKGSIIYENQQVLQPKILNAKLKDYQLKGLNWLVNLYNQGINGVLADDMGLGKTIQTISFLGHLYESCNITGPFLIITPASTLHNWENEFKRFIPTLGVVSYYGAQADRKEKKHLLKKSNVIITSYQIAVSDSILGKIKWQYMVLDEAQAIKSINSQRWKILLNFKSRNRLLLTGTPIQNTMQELWSLLHFIMPTLFDSLSEFSEWFTKNIENKEQINKLHTILKPFMLRRSKNDIKDEIGSKEIKNIECNMSNRQKLLYSDILGSKIDYENRIMQLKKVCNHPDLFEKLEASGPVGISVSGDVSHVGFRSNIKRFINYKSIVIDDKKEAINYLLENRSNIFKMKKNVEESTIINDIVRRRINIEKNLKIFKFIKEKFLDEHITVNQNNKINSVHPLMKRMDRLVFVPPLNSFISDSGKLMKLDLLLKNLKEEGHRVLIYFQMTRMMDLFEEYLIKKEYSYLRLDGSSKISNRKEIVEEWQKNSEMFIFILSTRAGGVGINLTAADTVIFYDSDWNPTVDQQAMDRAHRLGQTKDVTVYRLITKDSIEGRIMEKANKKNEMQKIIIKENVFEGFE